MTGRLYVVSDENTLSIVRAVSRGRALNHVVQSSYEVRVANANDVADYVAQGGVIEDATIADPPSSAPVESEE